MAAFNTTRVNDSVPYVTSSVNRTNQTSGTGGGLSESGEEFDYAPIDRAVSIISFCLFILIVVLNTLVLVTLFRRRRDRNRLHFYIIHLAIADLGVGLVSVLKDAITNALEHYWYGGDVLCRLQLFLGVIVLCASNNVLIGMSIDRFLVVRYPMKIMKIGNKMDRGLVIGAWALSVLLAVFFLVYSKGQNGYSGCFLTFPPEWYKPYFTIIAVIVYILPTLVIIVCYTGICIIVWKKWRKGLKLSETGNSNGKSRKGGGLLPKAKIKSIKTTVVICVAFFVCWTPYFASTLADVYSNNNMHPALYAIFAAFYPLNSAANPLIFILFNLELFWKVKRKDTVGRSLDEQQTLVTSA